MTDCLRARTNDENDDQFGFLKSLFSGVGSHDSGSSSQGKGTSDHTLLTKKLASKLDVDSIGRSFDKYAGSDENMDALEYARASMKSVDLRTPH